MNDYVSYIRIAQSKKRKSKLQVQNVSCGLKIQTVWTFKKYGQYYYTIILFGIKRESFFAKLYANVNFRIFESEISLNLPSTWKEDEVSGVQSWDPIYLNSSATSKISEN